MSNIIKSYKLGIKSFLVLPGEVQFEIIDLYNIFLIKGFLGSRLINLYNFIYFNYSKINGLILKFINKIIFKYIFYLLKFLSMSLFYGFFFELRLYGSGYFINKGFGILKKRLYRIYIGKTHYIYICLWNLGNILTRVGKSFIFFFCIDKYKLYDIIIYALLIRRVSFYKLNGVIFPEQLIIIREGKKKLI